MCKCVSLWLRCSWSRCTPYNIIIARRVFEIYSNHQIFHFIKCSNNNFGRLFAQLDRLFKWPSNISKNPKISFCGVWSIWWIQISPSLVLGSLKVKVCLLSPRGSKWRHSRDTSVPQKALGRHQRHQEALLSSFITKESVLIPFIMLLIGCYDRAIHKVNNTYLSRHSLDSLSYKKKE